MTNIFDRPLRVARKRLRLAIKYAPYLAGRSAPKNLVDEIYLGILGQDGDPAARARATEQLKSGRRTVLQIIQALTHTQPGQRPMFVSDFESLVAELYLGVLSREPTASELARDVSFLAGGSSVAQLLSRIMLAPAAKQIIFTNALADGGVTDLLLAHVKRAKRN